MDSAESRNMDNRYIVFVATGRGSRLLGALQEARWPVEYFQIDLPSRIERLITLMHILRSVLAHPAPAMLIVDQFGTYALFLHILSRFLPTKMIVRLRGFVWLEMAEALSHRRGLRWLRVKYLQLISSYLLRKAELVLPVSEHLGRTTVHVTGRCSSSVASIPIWIDIDRFSATNGESRIDAKTKLGYAASDHIILTVTNFGYWEKARALIDFVPAFDDVTSKLRGTIWVVAGDGQFRDQCAKIIRVESRSSSQIHFIGRVEQIETWYHACDVLLHYSYQDTFGNCILEAGAAAKPCIVNDFEAFRETVVDSRTGFLVSPHRTEWVVYLLTRLLEDRDLRTQLGNNAYDFVLNNFSAQAVGRHFEQAVSEAFPELGNRTTAAVRDRTLSQTRTDE